MQRTWAYKLLTACTGHSKDGLVRWTCENLRHHSPHLYRSRAPRRSPCCSAAEASTIRAAAFTLSTGIRSATPEQGLVRDCLPGLPVHIALSRGVSEYSCRIDYGAL